MIAHCDNPYKNPSEWIDEIAAQILEKTMIPERMMRPMTHDPALVPVEEDIFATPKNISDILDRQFVKTEDVCEILSLALTGQMNAIIYGPPGHGKSEMVTAALEGLGLSKETFVQGFHIDLDTSKLFRDHATDLQCARTGCANTCL